MKRNDFCNIHSKFQVHITKCFWPSSKNKYCQVAPNPSEHVTLTAYPTTTQWRSQGLPGWADSPTRRAKMRKKMRKV